MEETFQQRLSRITRTEKCLLIELPQKGRAVSLVSLLERRNEPYIVHYRCDYDGKGGCGEIKEAKRPGRVPLK